MDWPHQSWAGAGRTVEGALKYLNRGIKPLFEASFSLKFPICQFDARVGVLCPKCEARLRSGEITKTDVDVSFMLSKLAAKNPMLDKLTLKRAYEIDGDYVLLFEQGEAQVVLDNRNLMDELRRLGKPVWVSEVSTDERRFIGSLIHPIRIMGINQVWLPDGSRQIKAIIAGFYTSSFPIDLEKVKRIAGAVKGYDLVFKFEKERKRFEDRVF